MKRLLGMIVLFLFLMGCVPVVPRQTPVPSQTAQEIAETPAPSPTPAPVEVLFVADCSSQEAADFFFGAAQSAQAEGWRISTQAGDGFADAISLEKYDGILALITREDTPIDVLSSAIRAGAHVAIADMLRREPIPGSSYAYYDTAQAASMTLDAAIAYPPHDTPVRLIALLEQKGSPADDVFREGVKRGRVFPKATHYGTDKQNVLNFMEDKLDAYVEGTIDAVYTENEQLARAALDALSARSRSDMEVFCVPTGTLSEQRGLYEKWTFPVLMGADLFAVGEGRAKALAALMNGGGPQESSFAPVKRIPGETD
jgi:hypothetical protein